MKAFQLVITEDKALYQLVGDGYRIPLWVQAMKDVETHEKFHVVSRAMDYTLDQFNLIRLALELPSLGWRDGTYVFGYEKLPTCLEKTPGVTPERWLVWDGKKPTPERIEMDFESNEPVDTGYNEDKMLQEVHARTRYVDLPTLKLIWQAMNWVMVDWLVNRHRALHFSWGRVCPLMFRANWKSLILQKYPRSYSMYQWSSEAKLQEIYEKSGIIDEFMSPEMLEMAEARRRGTKVIDYYCRGKLEVLESPLLRRHLDDVQLKRLRKLGAGAYSRYVATQISRAKSYIFAAYRQFALRAAKSPARVVEAHFHGRSCDLRLIPKHFKFGPKTVVSRNGSNVIEGSHLDPLHHKAFTTNGSREDVEMRSVPDVRQEIPQLRDAGEQVDQPGDEEV